MNAIISAANIKTFTCALQCLSRFSETFWLQAAPQDDGTVLMRLSAINSTNSAFCQFLFEHDFFLRATVPSRQRVECQLTLKTVFSILRSRGRTVERCELDLVDDGDECRFSIKLHCNHGVLKTHRLTFEPKQGLLPTADPNPPNLFCINAQTGHEWTEHFLNSSKNGEITFWCGPDFCIVKSKEDEPPESKSQIRKAIHTEVKIELNEFREYKVSDQVVITFSLREFKATVTLAEMLQVPLEVNFSDGDQPLFIRTQVESVSAEFVLATTRGDQAEAPTAPQRGLSRAAPPPEDGATTDAPQQAEATQVTADNSMPSASETQLRAPDEPAPLESTPLPVSGRARGGTRRQDEEQPLFFSEASQQSTGAMDQSHDEVDELGEEHLHALDEVERAIESGQAEITGSQVIVRKQGTRDSSGEGTDQSQTGSRTRTDSQGNKGQSGSFELEIVEPTPVSKGGSNEEVYLAQLGASRRGRLGNASGSAEMDELGDDEDDWQEQDTQEDEVGSAGPPQKRFKPLFS